MADLFGDLIDKVRSHPRIKKGLAFAIIGVLLAAGEAATQLAGTLGGSLLEFLWATWLPAPLLAWLAILPAAAWGFWSYFRPLRGPGPKPDRALDLRWECQWEGNRIKDLRPVCPDLSCGAPIEFRRSGGRYPNDAIARCPTCGFEKHYVFPAATIKFDAVEHLERAASGMPPPEKRTPPMRVY